MNAKKSKILRRIAEATNSDYNSIKQEYKKSNKNDKTIIKREN